MAAGRKQKTKEKTRSRTIYACGSILNLCGIICLSLGIYVLYHTMDIDAIKIYSLLLIKHLREYTDCTWQALKNTDSMKLYYSTHAAIGLLLLILMTAWLRRRRQCCCQDSVNKHKKKTAREVTFVYGCVKFCVFVVMVAAAVSVPWEWIRMYQAEVAQRAATLYQDVPVECTPQHMSWMQSIKAWLALSFVWGHDPCYQYHHALLVNPVWEVTPLMALSAAFTRFVTTPLEIMASGVGQSLQRFLIEIPLLWQPLTFISTLILLTLLVLMTCGYKIHVPLLMTFEPQRTIAKKSSDSKTNRTVSLGTR